MKFHSCHGGLTKCSIINSEVTRVTLIAAALLLWNAPPAVAQFDQDVRRFYGDAIRTEMVPEIRYVGDLLRYELPLPSGFDPTNATPLEVAAVEQARVEAIRIHRMGTEERRTNWNTVLPTVESEIGRLLAIDSHIGGRQPTRSEMDQVQMIVDRINQIYEEFFDQTAKRAGRTADGGIRTAAYPASVYSKPAGARADEIDRGTYLLHRHYQRPIPWKAVRFGQGAHYTYGRVMIRARWPDGSGFGAQDWTHRKGYVVELHNSGPVDAGPNDKYPHPETGAFLP